MPKVLGWDRLKPLPVQFTAWPVEGQHKMMVVPDMENLYLDERPTVIDLFSGCGGFSLGFILAGWRVIASVEWDYWAHVTYAANIPKAQKAPVHCYHMDIRKLYGRQILWNAGIEKVDCIIGGPPCQSFSQIGKRKIGDERDSLLWEFGRLVKEIQPKTFIMENVPGLKSKKLPDGRKVVDAFMEYIKKT